METISPALGHLLGSNNTALQEFQFGNSALTEETLQPIVQGLIANSKITKLEWWRVDLEGEASTGLFDSMLRQKSSLISLDMDFGKLGWWPGLLEAVADSKLKFLRLASLNGRQLEALSNIIPELQLTELEFQTDVGVDEEGAAKQGLLAALEENYSLLEVTGTNANGDDLFNDDDKATMEVIFDRNQRLAGWVENPDTVPRDSCREALKIAANAGEWTLVRDLLVRSF